MAQIVYLGLHIAIKFKYCSRNGGKIFMFWDVMLCRWVSIFW